MIYIYIYIPSNPFHPDAQCLPKTFTVLLSPPWFHQTIGSIQRVDPVTTGCRSLFNRPGRGDCWSSCVSCSRALPPKTSYRRLFRCFLHSRPGAARHPWARLCLLLSEWMNEEINYYILLIFIIMGCNLVLVIFSKLIARCWNKVLRDFTLFILIKYVFINYLKIFSHNWKKNLLKELWKIK